jgi:signal transduction histidine kinase
VTVPLIVILAVGAFALAVALALAGARLARAQSALARARAALGELARGNLAYRLIIPGGGEAAGLASDVNALAQTLQEREDDARRRDEAQRRLVSNLSHDLRTPITSLAGYADALERGLGDEERTLSQISAKAAELKALTDDLFYVAKLDAGDLHLADEPIDLCEVARQTLLGFEQELRLRDVTVVAAIPEGACPIRGDATAVGRIISNLVANSLKHAAGMTTFGVAVLPGNGGVALVVSDDGAGFDAGVEELLERGAAAGPTGGTGLGLSIAHDLAARMGATIEATSEPSVRTAVTVTFREAA